MAVPIYKNPWTFPIAVPNYVGSTTVIPPGKLIQGSYYQYLADEGIVELYLGTYAPTDLIYTFPEGVGGGGGGGGTLTGVIAGSGLTGGGLSGTVTLGVATGGITPTMLAADAVTSSSIAAGTLVTSLNGLTDNVVFAAGTNITLTPVGQTVTVSAPLIGFTELNATLPLLLSTPDFGVTIDGSIAITPAHDGGAVALQSLGTPTFQTGLAAVDELYLPASGFINIGANLTNPGAYIYEQNDVANPYDYALFENNASTLIFKVGKDGVTEIASLLVTVGTITTTLTFGTGQVEIDPLTGITCDVPIILGNTGSITGTTGTSPITDFVAHSATVPAELFTSDIVAGLVAEVKDNTNAVTYSLTSDGLLTTKVVAADQLRVSVTEVTAGSYVLTTTSPSIYSCDAAASPVTFTLPNLTLSSPAGIEFVFKKTDVSANAVMVSAYAGQAIDGVTNKTITTQWGVLRVVSVVHNSNAYWLTI